MITTYESFKAAIVLAKLAGSFASKGSGRPCPTSQNGHRLVHLSPMIIKVAVPLPKHSPIFGQLASSQTVTSWFSRKIFLISVNRELLDAALTRIQSGFLRISARGTILIGIRAVLSADFCFCSGSYSFLGLLIIRVQDAIAFLNGLLST